MRPRRIAVIFGAVIGPVLLSGSPSAQTSALPPYGGSVQAAVPEPLEYIARDRGTIRVQFTLGITYLQQAVSTLQSATDPADLQEGERLAERSYRLMRVASEGLEVVKSKRSRFFTDPVLDMCIATIWRSRWLNIEARRDIADALQSEDGQGAQRAAQALLKLQNSLRFAEEAANLL